MSEFDDCKDVLLCILSSSDNAKDNNDDAPSLQLLTTNLLLDGTHDDVNTLEYKRRIYDCFGHENACTNGSTSKGRNAGKPKNDDASSSLCFSNLCTTQDCQKR